MTYILSCWLKVSALILVIIIIILRILDRHVFGTISREGGECFFIGIVQILRELFLFQVHVCAIIFYK